MKKLFAAVLAGAMVASIASISAFAAAGTVDDTNMPVTLAGNYYGDAVIGANTDTFKPDDALYILIDSKLANGDDFKAKFDKGDNSKMVKKISVVEKDKNGNAADGREHYIKIEINNDMTDTEFKMNPEITFTRKDATPFTSIIAQSVTFDDIGDALTFTPKFWISNTEQSGDKDWAAGTGGFIAKPSKNEDNEVIWTDNNRDLARITFTGDSDVVKYYPKLSTKWDNPIYAENFNEGEAFKFEFVGNPTISSTSRADLEIYNPFINSDDEYTVAVEELTVYQLIDGEFVDVTAQFKAGTNDDGDEVLTLKTRTLGTYIVCDEAAVNSGVTGNPTTDVPVKDVPNTGR